MPLLETGWSQNSWHFPSAPSAVLRNRIMMKCVHMEPAYRGNKADVTRPLPQTTQTSVPEETERLQITYRKAVAAVVVVGWRERKSIVFINQLMTQLQWP